MPNYTPTTLTIAGFDPYGGAGVVLDTKVIHSLNGYALSAITALTAQNSQGVKEVFATPTEFFRTQLFTILDDIKPDAIKIGMLANIEIVKIVIDAIDTFELKNIVLDTVLVSSSGHRLLSFDAVELMKKELFPRVDLITPNIPETETLCGFDFDFSQTQREKAFEYLKNTNTSSVLFKGGHSTEKQAVDYLYTADACYDFASPWIATTHTHGTGCFYSSAIATNLAKGFTLYKSVSFAKAFLYQSLQNSSSLQFDYRDKKIDRKEAIF